MQNIRDFSPIKKLENLRTLSLNGCEVADLEFCRSLNALRRLRALTRSGLADVSALATCASLRRVELMLNSRSGATLQFAPGTDVESVKLDGTITPDDVAVVAKMSNLRQLSLANVGWLDHLEYFKNLRELRRLSIVNCHDLRYARGISGVVKLEYLDLSGSDIKTTEFAQEMRELREVHLARCRNLADLTGLVALPKLEYVNLAGVSVDANVSALRLHSVSAQRLVIVETDYEKVERYQPFSGYAVS